MKLRTITANRHVFDGRVNDKPVRLLFCFDDGRRLRVQAKGEDVILKDRPLDDPFDMGEGGRIDVEDVGPSLFPQLIKADVVDTRWLVQDGSPVGIVFNLVSGACFYFWANGDELHWGDKDALVGHDWWNGSAPAPSERVAL